MFHLDYQLWFLDIDEDSFSLSHSKQKICFYKWRSLYPPNSMATKLIYEQAWDET